MRLAPRNACEEDPGEVEVVRLSLGGNSTVLWTCASQVYEGAKDLSSCNHHSLLSACGDEVASSVSSCHQDLPCRIDAVPSKRDLLLENLPQQQQS